MSPSTEIAIVKVVLVSILIVYGYLLFGPGHAVVPHNRNFILKPVTRTSFENMVNDLRSYKSDGYNNWGQEGIKEEFADLSNKPYKDGDDFYLDLNKNKKPNEPNVPSTKFHCEKGWVALKSGVSFKYFWMHDGESPMMTANAPLDTALHLKVFEMVPVSDGCTDGGWVLLRTRDREAGWVAMNNPKTKSEDEGGNPWAVELRKVTEDEAKQDLDFHFLLEDDGFLLNRGVNAFLNVIPSGGAYRVRGHSADYSEWSTTRTISGREVGASLRYQMLAESAIIETEAHEQQEDKESDNEDELLKKLIINFQNPSQERRYISIGLYGKNPKYLQGAIRNSELVQTYFPGWTIRFYVTADVPVLTKTQLERNGAEIQNIPDGLGYAAGMFWRFTIADDPKVDRFVVRDADSRLNARDRIAVEEWIRSGRKVHIMRDHVNHCLPINGGMWGAVHGGVSNIETKVREWDDRNGYGADLRFLENVIYPDLPTQDVLAHDSYCCERYAHTRPFPSKRFPNYQHVGQVFDSQGRARISDIEGIIRGVPAPMSCRKRQAWLFG
jgi:hypothetical protein